MPYPQTTPTSDQVGVLHLGQAPCYVQYAGVNTNGTTTYPLITTSEIPAGFAPVILGMALSSAGAAGVSAYAESNVTTSIVSGTFTLPAQGNVVLPETSGGWFSAAANEGITIVTNTSGVNVGVTAAWCLFAHATP